MGTLHSILAEQNGIMEKLLSDDGEISAEMEQALAEIKRRYEKPAV